MCRFNAVDSALVTHFTRKMLLNALWAVFVTHRNGSKKGVVNKKIAEHHPLASEAMAVSV